MIFCQNTKGIDSRNIVNRDMICMKSMLPCLVRDRARGAARRAALIARGNRRLVLAIEAERRRRVAFAHGAGARRAAVVDAGRVLPAALAGRALCSVACRLEDHDTDKMANVRRGDGTLKINRARIIYDDTTIWN